MAKARREEAAFNLTGRAGVGYRAARREAISQAEAVLKASLPDLQFMEAKVRLERSLHPEMVAVCPPVAVQARSLTKPFEVGLLKALVDGPTRVSRAGQAKTCGVEGRGGPLPAPPADTTNEPPYRFTGPEDKRTPLSSFILWKDCAADLFRRFMSFVLPQGYRVMLTKGTLLAALRFNSVGWYDAELGVRNLVDADYDVVILRPGAVPPKLGEHDPLFFKIAQLLRTEPLFASRLQCGFALTHSERDWFDEDDIPTHYRFGVWKAVNGKRFFRGMGVHIDVGIVYEVDGRLDCDREVYHNIGYEWTPAILPASTFHAAEGFLNLEGVRIPAINLWGYSAWRWSAQRYCDSIRVPAECTLARALEWCAELRYPLIEQVEDSVYRHNANYYTKTESWNAFWDRAMSASDPSAKNFNDLELNMRQIYDCLLPGR